MPLTREEAIEKLMAHYQEPYLCARRMDPSSLLSATAFMHLVSERKLLSLANVGIAESDDFVYIYSPAKLDEDTLERCCAEALEDGLKRVDPNPNHQFSLVSVFFLCDTMSPGAAAKLKKQKYHKAYKKPEYGWVDLRLAAVETGSGNHAANAMGKTLLHIYKEAVR